MMIGLSGCLASKGSPAIPDGPAQTGVALIPVEKGNAVNQQALVRTLKSPLIAVLRRLHLLEEARWARTVGGRVAARELRYKVFGAPDKLPLPPQKLHDLISGRHDVTIHDYLSIGRGQANALVQLLRDHAPSLRRLEPVLDFGCGCGRVARHLWSAEVGLRVWGSDINAEQIAWCRAHLPFETLEVNRPTPPLIFSKGAFGLVYAFSVFTHLPADLQRPWLEELLRVLRPGGCLFLSLHGVAHAARLTPGERAQFDAGRLVVLRPEDAAVPDRYAMCSAFHPSAYVVSEFARGLTVLRHVQGEVQDSVRGFVGQDLYLFQKPT
jgi:SAM-dependent methyltransferase